MSKAARKKSRVTPKKVHAESPLSVVEAPESEEHELGPLCTDPITVAFCYPETGVAGQFTEALLSLNLYESQGLLKALHEGLSLPPMNFARGSYVSLQSGPRVAEARSQLITAFLTKEEYAHSEWLLMIDADQSFDAAGWEIMLRTIDKDRVPVLGGLCFAGGYKFPTLFIIKSEEGELERIDDFPENALLQVDATGASFLCVHRKVLMDMAARYGLQPNGNLNPYPWFVEGMINKKGDPYGEDITFCLRLRDMGIPVHVHTGIETGHSKMHEYFKEDFYAYREAEKRKAEAEEITEATA